MLIDEVRLKMGCISGAQNPVIGEMRTSFLIVLISRFLADWDDVPIYVVGEKTASSLRNVFARYTGIHPDIRGQESGSAASLATFILSDVHGRFGTNLLYLTGDKNRDTLSSMLSGENIKLEPLQVYRTQESPSFDSRLSSVLELAPKGQWPLAVFSLRLSSNDLDLSQGAAHWWIVYFAPSSASFATPILEDYFQLQGDNDDDGNLHGSNLCLPTKIAVIGPTTHAFLIEQLRLRVDATAEQPAPKDLVSAVENFDRKHSLNYRTNH
jgi:uroporphyrinogen-III synthase